MSSSTLLQIPLSAPSNNYVKDHQSNSSLLDLRSNGSRDRISSGMNNAWRPLDPLSCIGWMNACVSVSKYELTNGDLIPPVSLIYSHPNITLVTNQFLTRSQVQGSDPAASGSLAAQRNECNNILVPFSWSIRMAVEAGIIPLDRFETGLR
jgi:hypothetical protein